MTDILSCDRAPEDFGCSGARVRSVSERAEPEVLTICSISAGLACQSGNVSHRQLSGGWAPLRPAPVDQAGAGRRDLRHAWEIAT